MRCKPYLSYAGLLKVGECSQRFLKIPDAVIHSREDMAVIIYGSIKESYFI
jgi:hypothetical protein